MVLKKHCLYILFVFLFTSNLLATEENYWEKLILTSFRNNPNVVQLKKDYTSQIIYKKQNDYLWFPYFQLDVNQGIEENRGDYFYVQNQYPTNNNIWLLSPTVSLSINQKLPGNGLLNLSTSYSFNYLIDRNVFLQKPQIQFSFNQTLGSGIFDITKDPEKELLNTQLEYSYLYFTKELINQLLETINLIKNFDILNEDEKYYFSMVEQYNAEMMTASEKQKNGLQSNLETYYASHQYLNAKNQLTQIQNQKTEILNEIKLLIPDFNYIDLESNRKKLEQIIIKLFSDTDISDIKQNYDAKCYENILKQQQINYKNNENNFLPLLYISSNIIPDSNQNIYYADWYKSFRNLTETPYPLSYTTYIGIKLNFETIKAKKYRKVLYRLEKNATTQEFLSYIYRQENEYNLQKQQLDSLQQYYLSLENEIEIEQNFREDRKKLFEQKIITQNEYYESETLYFLLNKDYVSTFWEIITNQLKIIKITSNTNRILITFVGENYETLF